MIPKTTKMTASNWRNHYPLPITNTEDKMNNAADTHVTESWQAKARKGLDSVTSFLEEHGRNLGIPVTAAVSMAILAVANSALHGDHDTSEHFFDHRLAIIEDGQAGTDNRNLAQIEAWANENLKGNNNSGLKQVSHGAFDQAVNELFHADSQISQNVSTVSGRRFSESERDEPQVL